MSYDELSDRVDRLAAALQVRDVGLGDRVAYLGNNHPSFVETMFGSCLLGAIFVPLNTRLSARELSYMLEDSGASVLISTVALESAAAAAVAGVSARIRRIVVNDPDPADPRQTALEAEDYEAVMKAAPPQPAGLSDVTHEDRALIVYTSGTTGKPKGAVLTHGNLTWNAINVLVDYDVASTDRALMISPLFHVASLGMGCLPMLLKGATLLLEERFTPAVALASIEQHRATSISGVPTAFQLMMEDPAWISTDISSLRMLTCGGSAVPTKVRQAYEARGLAFSGGYGMTETSPGVTMLPPRFSAERAGSAGLAHTFTEFRIREIEGSREGATRGEIQVRGPNVFLEYWRNPTATAQAFTDDGWLRTCDIGYADDRGFLYILDRMEDVIISGGENIYPAEVEQAILAIPGVTGAAVVGVPHDRWGEVPHAFVTLVDGAALDPEEMVAQLSAQLARYKVPRTVEVIDEIPRTSSGKVQRHILRMRD